MIDQLKKDIEVINSNLEVLPKNNKKNIEKYVEYIDEVLVKYKPLLDNASSIINARYNEVLSKYKDLTYSEEYPKVDYFAIKLSDNRVFSYEKMNLDYLLFKLNNLSGNIEEVNNILLTIIENFKQTGIVLTEKDFNHTESVNLYIKTLLNNSNVILDVLNDIFWKNPDIIKQIELNIKYLYYKNESKIDEYYKLKFESFNFHEFITNHRATINSIDMQKHKNIKYIYDLFMNKEYEVEDFMVESRVQDLVSTLLTDPSSDRNYDNLLNLNKSLKEFQGFLKYQYIVNDFKELLSHKEEYKGLYLNKLKEIFKQEKNLFAINKKLNKTGFFKLSKQKLADARLERNKVINELDTLYKELDDLKIKEFVFRYLSSNTNYYDALKFATYNFNYYVQLLKKDNDDIKLSGIESELLNLQKFIYDNEIDIIDNINLSEDKNIAKIISERYKLNSVIVDENKLVDNQINGVIQTVDKLLTYYDIYYLGVNLKDFSFLLEVPKIIKK